jgi:hypothetical protein
MQHAQQQQHGHCHYDENCSTYSICWITKGRLNVTAFNLTAFAVNVDQFVSQIFWYASLAVYRKLSFIAKIGPFAADLIGTASIFYCTLSASNFKCMMCTVQIGLHEQTRYRYQ